MKEIIWIHLVELLNRQAIRISLIIYVTREVGGTYVLCLVMCAFHLVFHHKIAFS